MPLSSAPAAATWIPTVSGVKFDLLNPSPADVRIEDIAHALARIPRWTGHTTGAFGFSVAQHSILVAERVAPEFALESILHDGSEAYLLDLPRPLKYHPALLGYRAIEGSVQAAIAAKFGVPAHKSPAVALADVFLMRWERRDLIAGGVCSDDEAMDDGTPLPDAVLVAWPPEEAQARFLAYFEALTAPVVDPAGRAGRGPRWARSAASRHREHHRCRDTRCLLRARQARGLHNGDEVTIRGAVYTVLLNDLAARTVSVYGGPDGYLDAVPWREFR